MFTVEPRVRTTVAALLAFAVLSLVFTYPLPLHLADAVEDRQDALLNVWIAAWDGHQLLADPLHLFDANILAPYRRTLAYSELLLGNALLALPITAATGNPVLGYNVALLLSFVLSGLGMYLLVVRLTRRPAAGMAAGLIFAFSSYRMANLAQAQLLATQWLAFALLALHGLRERPRARTAALFVLFFWLQAVSSFYYGILLALAVAGFWIFHFAARLLASRRRFRDDGAQRRADVPTRSVGTMQDPVWRSVRYSLLAACCLLLLLLPFVLPYFQVQREMGFQRTLADSEPFSASLRQYALVPPGSVLHGLWLPTDEQPRAGGYPVDALFPGIAAVGLAALGAIRGRGRARWLYVLLLIAAFLLSLGPRLYLAPDRPAGLSVPLPYAWLYALVPGFKALRAPVRFDALVTLALAVLAGYGVAAIGRAAANGVREPILRRGSVVAAIACGLVLLESLVWPGARAEHVPVGAQVPAVYRWLAEQPHGTVLELPMAFAEGGPQLEYQYLSVYHWQTTPDGYSGFIPPTSGPIAYEMERFPSERSVSLLQGLGVQRVVVHLDRYGPERRAALEADLAGAADLVPAGTFGADRVYDVAPREMDLRDLELAGYLPPAARAGEPYTMYIVAANHGERSLAVRPGQVLDLNARWTIGREVVTGRARAAAPLIISPGGVAVIPVRLTAPAVPGSYALFVGAASDTWSYWSSGGVVRVGDQASTEFPVPARLEGGRAPATARAGQPLRVDLAWRALGKIDAYYSVYVKLLDGQGNAVAGWDGQPRGGRAPTLEWMPGERVTDTVTLAIPAATAPGEYRVEVGMYRAGDLARCLLIGADGALLDRVTVGTVRIQR